MEIIDEELREAAQSGNVEFLQKCVDDNKPNHYYLTLFPERLGDDIYYYHGNIFHIAAFEQQEEWIREAINLLPLELVHQLICQPNPDGFNPLHLAGGLGNLKIVKMFLNAFTSLHLPLPNPPPWLMKNTNGFTPCHFALRFEKEECGLEILRMDMESLSNMLDNSGLSLLTEAIRNGQEKVAMEIISSPYSFSASARYGRSALFYMPYCSSSPERGKEIGNLLLKKMPKLIRKRDTRGMSIFHIWAMTGKLWSFECLLESSDIIQDIRHVFVELISATDDGGKNPLHYLPLNLISIEEAQIGKLLIDTYKYEHGEEAQYSSNILSRELQYPWLVQDNENKTPLDHAVDKGKEELAKMILAEDKNALKTCQENVLFVAIEKRFEEVVLLKILEIVNEERLTHLLTNDQKLNALHLAPKCKRTFCERLIEQHPKLIEGVSKEGETILHTWVKIGQVWPFEYLLNNSKIEYKWRIIFINLLPLQEKTKNNNALHVVATCTNESTLQIVKLLLQAYKDLLYGFLWINPDVSNTTPWITKNKDGEGALHVAIRCQKDQKLALYLLSLQPDGEDEYMAKWLDIDAPNEHSIIFLAIQRKFFDVVKTIFSKLNKESWSKYLQDSANDNNNVLHLASTCTDAELAQFLVEEAPEFISQRNKNGITPLELACEKGATRIVKAMLEKDPSAFNKAPLAWVKACENEHSSVIQAFVDCCPIKFSDHCKDQNDTPLHHIKLRNLTRYEDFLKIQYMKDLVNVKDSTTGATPLHKAIETGNIFLAEALLNMDNIKYNIKDNDGKTAREMLAELCKEPQPLPKPQWAEMCKNIGFDPTLETSYFKRKTDLLEVRNTLSVVAALLATITFTVGFTLPGGLNQDTGEAMIVNKAAFVVFLISDALAMCFSMVVLICLIWSMVLEPNESLYLIDRSVGLLRLALYLTLIAFVTGVYIVISPKLFWAAIVIIVLCSLVLGVSLRRSSLYKVFKFMDNLYSSVTKKIQDQLVTKKIPDPMHRMELGLGHSGESSNQNCTATSSREKSS